MVQDVKLGDLEATRRIQTYVRALTQGVTTCPLVQRSLDIITNSLRSRPTYIAPQEDGVDAVSRNYLPAFPYREMQIDFAEAQLGPMDIDAFSMLDSFPEQHLDHVTEWYMPSG